MVQKLVEAVNIELNEEKFISTRLSKKLNAPNLMKLKSEDTRRKILEHRKAHGTLEMKDCGYQEQNIVYFYEDLP